jgi:hypothetical protein
LVYVVVQYFPGQVVTDGLAQLTQAHKGLNSQPNTRIWLEKQISQRERVGECFFVLGL